MSFRQRFVLSLLLLVIALKDIYAENVTIWYVTVAGLILSFWFTNNDSSPLNGTGKDV